jgi:hypothetical protein
MIAYEDRNLPTRGTHLRLEGHDPAHRQDTARSLVDQIAEEDYL